VSTLATYQVRARRPEAALQTLEAHPQMLNAEPILQGVRGWALSAAGQAEQAKQVFARAVERSQNLAQVLAVTSYLSNAYGAEQAAAELAAIPSPTNPLWVQLALADLQAKAGQAAEAAQRLQRIAPEV